MAEVVDQHGEKQDNAVDELLPIYINVQQHQSVVDKGKQQQAQHGSENGADTAVQRSAADDGRRDRCHFLPVADDRRGDGETGRCQNARDTAEQTGYNVDAHFDFGYIDTGIVCCLCVGTDIIHFPHNTGIAEQEPEDHCHDHTEQDQERDRADHALAEIQKTLRKLGHTDTGALGQDHRDTFGNTHRTQRTDHRSNGCSGTDQTIDCTDADRTGDADDRSCQNRNTFLHRQIRQYNTGQGHRGTNRQVNTAAGQDDRHGRDQEHITGRAQDRRRQVGLRQKERGGDCHHHAERDEDQQNGRLTDFKEFF